MDAVPLGSNDHQERRRAARRRMLQRADIIIGDGLQQCLLLDVTDRGARLESQIPLVLPAEFSVRLPDGRQVGCIRRWSVGQRFGVEFVLGEDMVTRATALLELVNSLHAAGFFTALRNENHFGSSEIGQNARVAEIGLRAISAALTKILRSVSGDGKAEDGRGQDKPTPG